MLHKEGGEKCSFFVLQPVVRQLRDLIWVLYTQVHFSFGRAGLNITNSTQQRPRSLVSHHCKWHVCRLIESHRYVQAKGGDHIVTQDVLLAIVCVRLTACMCSM